VEKECSREGVGCEGRISIGAEAKTVSTSLKREERKYKLSWRKAIELGGERRGL